MADHGTSICTEVPRAEQIARLNDQLRKTGTGGTVMITQGVKRITGFDAAQLAAALAEYDEFDPDGDPHGERDFGALTMWGYDLLWKVDYYDKDLKYGADDPADPAVSLNGVPDGAISSHCVLLFDSNRRHGLSLGDNGRITPTKLSNREIAALARIGARQGGLVTVPGTTADCCLTLTGVPSLNRHDLYQLEEIGRKLCCERQIRSAVENAGDRHRTPPRRGCSRPA